LGLVEKYWRIAFLGGRGFASVAAFRRDYSRPSFANGDQGARGVDGEPRLAGELRLPCGIGRRRFEYIIAVPKASDRSKTGGYDSVSHSVRSTRSRTPFNSG
jgi:hypothetical protein